MKMERQAAMVKSVAKNMRTKERKEAKNEKIITEMYAILRKVGKSLDEVTKEELTAKEYKTLISFIEDVRQWNISLYPNLQ